MDSLRAVKKFAGVCRNAVKCYAYLNFKNEILKFQRTIKPGQMQRQRNLRILIVPRA